MKTFQRPVFKGKGTNRQHRGIVFGVIVEHEVGIGPELSIGWSLCNRNSGDAYHQDYGLSLARDRALHRTKETEVITPASEPFTMSEAVQYGIPQSVLHDIGVLIDNVRKNNAVKIVSIYTTKKGSVDNSLLWMPKALTPQESIAEKAALKAEYKKKMEQEKAARVEAAKAEAARRAKIRARKTERLQEMISRSSRAVLPTDGEISEAIRSR